jgi:hypothetical protein
MKKSFALALPLLLLGGVSVGGHFPDRLPAKKLIEFGWDQPDTAYLRKHIREMQHSPFSGCVFIVNYTKPDGAVGSFYNEAWGQHAFTEAELRPAIQDLQATSFGRFNHNFLRLNVSGVDWFDDFSTVVNNARLAARAAREGRCKGILFDIESYHKPRLFCYSEQRDAGSKSWDEYAAQARRRGREVMEAFQQGYPDGIILLTFGYSLPWEQMQNGNRTLAQVGYGLLAPFLDGMTEAARGRIRLVDGNEGAYQYKQPEQFVAGCKMMRSDLRPIVADLLRYDKFFTHSHGIWMDFDSAKKGWDCRDTSKNPLPPELFEAMVREALETTDEYVWIYSQQPRWWTESGKRENLPPIYEDALRRAAKAANESPTAKP